MNTDQRDFDVIIVGGRPAGASLAARLGEQGARVLVLERATFPSYPAVSSPFVLGHTMALLDEIGVDESAYAIGAPRIPFAILEFKDWFKTAIPLGQHGRRDYCYTVDRQHFDAALWENLARFPSVTTREGLAVTDLVRNEAGRIVGVIGKDKSTGDEVRFEGRCVVGADGRWSTVARRAGAEIIHERKDCDTHVYYAFWTGVADFDETGEQLAHIHTSADGWSAVIMPMSEGRCSVLVQARSDLFEAAEGSPDEIYQRALEERPGVWRRLESAQQSTALSGMKRMGNLFRTPCGPGWALVGDAYHQKDSIDAQGIYDALLGAKLLAEAMSGWLAGEVALEAALSAYGKRVWESARPMFDATMGRVKREIYSIPPAIIAKTVLRWLLTHPEYQRRFSMLLVRRLDPSDFLTPGLAMRALSGGPLSDIKRTMGFEPKRGLPE